MNDWRKGKAFAVKILWRESANGKQVGTIPIFFSLVYQILEEFTMKTRELNKIAYDIADLDAVIGLTQNYISCLQLQAVRAKDNNDRFLILHSLIHGKGFDNIMSNLEILSEQINSLADEILDHGDEVAQ